MERFSFRRTYCEIVEEADKLFALSDKDKLQWYEGIIHYALDNVDPIFDNEALALVWKAFINDTGKSLKDSCVYDDTRKLNKAGVTKNALSPELATIIANLWNTTCAPVLPKVIDIKGTRKTKLLLRMTEAECGESNEARVEWCNKLFTKCAETPFLKGENNHHWRASFDWLIGNDKNWKKVLEGRYDDADAATKNLDNESADYWTKGLK